MQTVNLLKFLESVDKLSVPEFVTINKSCDNLLDLILPNSQFIRSIDYGLIYYSPTKNSKKHIIIDGTEELVSLSLLLHAICECYKKTTSKNEKAIKTIRQKYLFKFKNCKLVLPQKEQQIYEKIINGEPLMYLEKQSVLFRTLHSFWERIKREKLVANELLHILSKLEVTLIETDNNDIMQRNIYYNLNKGNSNIDQLLLIKDYLLNYNLEEQYDILINLFKINPKDIYLFFIDLFATKIHNTQNTRQKLYVNFVNYFESIIQYTTKTKAMDKLLFLAELYRQILYVDIENLNIKREFVDIKLNKGEDTYAYLLTIYDDYVSENISEETFIEILKTINEYLSNRLKNKNEVSFNELIEYLNGFLICK